MFTQFCSSTICSRTEFTAVTSYRWIIKINAAVLIVDDLHVFCETSQCQKSFLAHAAAVRLIASVQALMGSHATPFSKAAATVRAFMRSVGRVGLAMLIQVTRLSELFTANFALERTFTCVCTHMGTEVT